jgi:hypothetical protein
MFFFSLQDLGSSLDGLGQQLVLSSSSQDLHSPASSSNHTLTASTSADLLTPDALPEDTSEQEPGMEGLSPHTLQVGLESVVVIVFKLSSIS